MPYYVTFNPEDKIIDSQKVTTGYFSGDVGTINSGSLTTSSLSSTQKEYFYNLQYNSKDHWSVAYGHPGGSGSGDAVGQTKAVYEQFASTLLFPDQVEKGFVFSGSYTLANRISDVWFLVAERARMKDRLNLKNWTLTLSGSTYGSPGGGFSGSFSSSYGTGIGRGHSLKLTDDSETVAAAATPIGPRYNIVSGTLGSPLAASSSKYYGHFYPNLGVLVFDGTELSKSLNGNPGYRISSSIATHRGVGFAPFTSTSMANSTGSINALKLAKAIQLGSIKFRAEEDQTTVSWFCRARAGDFNFSNNPTFYTGSLNEFTNRDYEGNPQTFITTVGLYDSADNVVAAGRLSTPVQKNYNTEAVIKVNLTY